MSSTLNMVLSFWKNVLQRQAAVRLRPIIRHSELTTEMAQTPSTSNNDASFVHTKSLIETEPVKNLSDAHSNTSLTLITSKPTRKEIVRKLNELLNELQSANGETLIRRKGEELKNHLLDYPASKMVVIENEGAIKFLKKWATHALDRRLRGTMEQCLSLCGNVARTKNPSGICVLTIDGGGTRGIMGLEILSELEKVAGKKIPELFDLIVGVSTGSIIATMLAAKGMSISETKEAYLSYCSQVFKTSVSFEKVWSLGGRLASLKENTGVWTNILKETLGTHFSMIGSASDPKIPRVAIISIITNTIQLIPFIFRSYEHSSYDSRYRGSAKYQFWEAIRASSAAPTYFEEFKLDGFMHQDGGILLNNPTSIALQEAKQLWPHKNFQCIVSVGNGQFLPEIEPTIDERRNIMLSTPYQLNAWLPWLSKHYNTIMESATETELFHHCINSLIPSGNYFRFNPYMSLPEGYALDTKDVKLLEFMRRDAQLYMRRNRVKIEEAAEQLTRSNAVARGWRTLSGWVEQLNKRRQNFDSQKI